MSKETYVQAITINSPDPVRVVEIPEFACLDIRIGNLRIAVFHPDDERVPEVIIQDEKTANHYERHHMLMAQVGIPNRKKEKERNNDQK